MHMYVSVDIVESIMAAVSVSDLISVLRRFSDNIFFVERTCACLNRSADASGSAKKELTLASNIKVIASIEKEGGPAAEQARSLLQCLEDSENMENLNALSKSQF